jgi:hypothetical protein
MRKAVEEGRCLSSCLGAHPTLMALNPPGYPREDPRYDLDEFPAGDKPSKPKVEKTEAAKPSSNQKRAASASGGCPSMSAHGKLIRILLCCALL